MIHIFNRRELLLTNDPREINWIRELLLANRIDYKVKVLNSSIGATRNRVSFARREEQHIVYVHKADWEYAMYLLRNAK